MSIKSVSLRELALKVNGTVHGNPDIEINAISELSKASADTISPVWEKKFLSDVKEGNVLLTREGWTPENCSSIEVKDPRRALVDLLNIFDPKVLEAPRISESAVISDKATIGKNVYIGPHCVISEGAVISDNVRLAGNNWISNDVKIGKNTMIEPGAVIYDRVTIGENCIIHSNAVIGSDGFGFMPDPDVIMLRIPQIGTVTIEDDVEIGTCTCIDRATFGDTHISKGSKIDALVKVGHNCKIGMYCIAVSQSGIAGSSNIGNFVTLAAQSGVANHSTVGDHTTLCARTGVVCDVPAGKVLSGFPAQEHSAELKQMAILRKLPELYSKLKELYKKIEKLEEKFNVYDK